MHNVTTKATVLCGGLGKRLRPLTYYFQKTMIPVGRRQKPLLEYIVRLLKKHDFKDIVLLVGYKAEQVKNYFENGERFGVRITYVHDDPAYKGTAGALYNAYKKGYLDADEILVYYGDILSNINLSEMLRYHLETESIATLALSKGYRVRVGVAHMDSDGSITKFEEKPEIKLPVSIGILILNKEALSYLEVLIKAHEKPDIMSHLIPRLIREGKRVMGYITSAFWYDLGSTERYEKLEEMRDLVEKELEKILI